MTEVDPEIRAILEAAGLAGRLDSPEMSTAALGALSEDDLRRMGLSLGQRKRLLQRLRQVSGAAPGGPEMERASLAVAAAEQALQRPSLAEALDLLQEADAALARAVEGADADRLRLRVLIARSAISRTQLGIASDEAGRLGRQVLELARRLQDTRSELVALTGLYTHALVRAEYFNAGKWAELLSERAEQAQDATFRMIGRRGMGVVALHTGSLTQAKLALQEALDSYDEASHLPLAHQHGYDHAEISAAFLSFALWIGGDPEGGRGMSGFSVSHSRRIGHMHSLDQALVFRAMLMALAHDWSESLAAAREGEEVGRRHGFDVMGTACSFFATVAELCIRPDGPGPAELRALRHSHAAFRRVNPYNYQQVCGLLLALLHVRSGALAEAEEALHKAEAMQERTREIFLQPELMRVRAQISVARGAADAAREVRGNAMQVASRMGATTFALRIACDAAEAEPSAESLAKLAVLRGKMLSDDAGADMLRSSALLAARR